MISVLLLSAALAAPTPDPSITAIAKADDCASALATAVSVISCYDSGGGRTQHAVVTATSTPINKFGSSAVIFDDERRDAHPADTKKVPAAWLVTATATASPTATRHPTANAEATCVAGGHDWTSNWTGLKNPHAVAGDGSILDWPTKAHLALSVEATEPDHDQAWSQMALRCRRCRLWKGKP